MKILIVEDEDILLKVLKEKFEDENFKVEIAVDGEEAMHVVKKFMPDIILLDILLPKKNGIEVLAFIKADDSLSSIPVIMLSNLSEDEKIKEALNMGAVDYMVKTQHPINEIVEKANKYVLKAK